ncbi:helix-turn-helix domain-containing protein [Pseudoxanthomonas sp. UTMC 1351]|uniref:AraC family transcriptional regulator n=1 Tax=Pseudoxanthomonas sp. UTMC 1351 TaxID=2695853 RepID=UPI0034CF8E73
MNLATLSNAMPFNAAVMDIAAATALTGGMQVERMVTRPGPVTLEPAADHRIKIHTGAPVTGTCHSGRFMYQHGDIDLLPTGSSDDWVEDVASTSVILRFPPALMTRAAEHIGLDGSRASITPRHNFRDAQIQHIGWALDADHEAGHPSGRVYTESLSIALIAHLLARHRTAPATPPARGLSKQQLQRVTEYIDTHLDDDLSLFQLAQVAGISASHLKTLFKRSIGMPVHAYVVRQRVNRAVELLRRGDLPASHVALEAGFSHQSHMLRCMRRVLGRPAIASSQ